MNDERPDGPKKVDGRPFDGGLGQTAKAAGGVLLGQPQLSAEQLHGDKEASSWKAPRENPTRWGTTRIVTLMLLLAILAFVIYFKAAGVF